LEKLADIREEGEGRRGYMYTTWRNDYGKVEEFAGDESKIGFGVRVQA